MTFINKSLITNVKNRQYQIFHEVIAMLENLKIIIADNPDMAMRTLSIASRRALARRII